MIGKYYKHNDCILKITRTRSHFDITVKKSHIRLYNGIKMVYEWIVLKWKLMISNSYVSVYKYVYMPYECIEFVYKYIWLVFYLNCI